MICPNAHEEVNDRLQSLISIYPMNKRKQFWLRHYACRAFQHTIESCRFIHRYGIHPDSSIYYPLMIAAYVIYSRPFMNSFGIGRLDNAFIPPSRLDDHEHLMKMRSTFFAHSDATQKPSFHEPSNGIIVFSKHGQVECALHEMKTLPSGLPMLHEMALLLLQKAHDEGEILANEIGLKATVPDGVYHLSLEDESTPLLVPTEGRR